MRARLALSVALLLAAACQRRHPAPIPETHAWDDELPDVEGFHADPPVGVGGAHRRVYVRAGARVTVTVARFPMDGAQYQAWVRTSTAGFPQALLAIPDGTGNGFYQCDDRAPPSCSLLIQFRAGVHLEIRGEPGTRADVDAVGNGLPLDFFAALRPAAP